MNMPISQAEKQAMFEKRQQLFSLWRKQEPTPEPSAVPVSSPQSPARQVSTRDHPDEVRDMLQKFANPNADRLTLF